MSYRGPNGIPKYFLERARTIISVVQISDSEDEPVTCGMPNNFIVLNSPVTGHLDKMIIKTNSDETCGVGIEIGEATSV